MPAAEAWNPLTDWKPVEVDWVRVRIAPEDLRRFTRKSDFKGFLQTGAFLALLAATGTLAWFALGGRHWILLGLALYAHGTFYMRFGEALHELGHNTVFASRWINVFVTGLFGWLYWTWNPHLYRISHLGYHHRYTLYQGSDGEDVPGYVELTPGLVAKLFLHVVHPLELARNLGRLVTLKPTSIGWRGRGYRLDTWEQFILKNASEKDRRAVRRFAAICLAGHAVFVAASLAAGLWLLPVLVTLAPFYGSSVLSFLATIHQHTACEANHPDYRASCGDAILDPFSSFLYWHMEYHIEHHMFAAIPCYNLKAFSRFVADQLPPKERTLPRLLKLHRVCREKYGSRAEWSARFGRFKGL